LPLYSHYVGKSQQAGGSEDFVTHFIEQGSWETLLVIGVPAAVFVALVAAVVAVARRRVHVRAKPFLAAVAFSLVAFVVGLTIYEAAALYFRFLPNGSGLERQDGSADTYVFSARAGFIALYAVVLGLAGGLGALLLRSGRWAAAATATVAVFMVVTFPYVDFLNECNIGQPLISWSAQRC
jgi:hypothetical protein